MSADAHRPQDVAEHIASRLTRGDEGEQYALEPKVLEETRAMLAALAGKPELDGILKAVFKVAWMLDTQLASPAAARALLTLGLEFGGLEVFGRQAPTGPIGDAAWRSLVGAERGTMSHVKQPKSGKFPWELIGGTSDDDAEE